MMKKQWLVIVLVKSATESSRFKETENEDKTSGKVSLLREK